MYDYGNCGWTSRTPKHGSSLSKTVKQRAFEIAGKNHSQLKPFNPGLENEMFAPKCLFTFVFCILVNITSVAQFQITDSLCGSALMPPQEGFGKSMAYVGDVDGDGFGDYIIGAPDSDITGLNSGEATVISGFDYSPIFGWSGGAAFRRFGQAVGSAGDVNGDGYTDFIVTVPALREITLWSGQNGAFIRSTPSLFTGNGWNHTLDTVLGLGDIDGDGIDDYAWGEPMYQTIPHPVSPIGSASLGLVRVFSGATGSTIHLFTTQSIDILFGVSLAHIKHPSGPGQLVIGTSGFGASSYSLADGSYVGVVLDLNSGTPSGGRILASLGDLNDDGFDELGMGAPSPAIGAANQFGRIQVVDGASIAAGSFAVLFAQVGESPGDEFGWAIAKAGDIDLDGVPDFAVGAPGANSGDGSVKFLSGRHGGFIHEIAPTVAGSRFGTTVVGGFDVDADGLMDCAVASEVPVAGDCTFFFRSLDPLDRAFRARTIIGRLANERWGAAISAAGDLNGDGFADYLVGAPSGSDFGKVRAISGRNGVPLLQLTGNVVGDLFGVSIAGGCDVNNDGTPDIIVGASNANVSGMASGTVQVFSGADGSVLHTWHGDSAWDFLGTSVSAPGDLNGDGFDDVLVGAPASPTLSSSAGYARIFSGVDGSILFTFAGGSSQDRFAQTVAGIGDVNLDSVPDIIVGAPKSDFFLFSDTGSALVYSGSDGALIYSLQGVLPNQRFGQVGAVGDINADGVPDFAVNFPPLVPSTTSPVPAIFSGADASVLGYSSGGENLSGGGDYDGDGTPDLIASNGGNSIQIRRLNGSVIAEFLPRIANNDFGSVTQFVGDLNCDGADDIVVGSPQSDQFSTNGGIVEIIVPPTPAVAPYVSKLGYPHNLRLSWHPDGGDINAPTGTLTCVGANPGASGQIGVSLAPVDISFFVFFFDISILISLDPDDVLMDGNFGFDLAGKVNATGISRQFPNLAGIDVYIQFYQISGFIPRSSNGIRMTLIP